ncbi:unnamed protein product, partial [marine sediment metagenome]
VIFELEGEPGWVWAEATGKNNPLGWVPKELINAKLAAYEISAEAIAPVKPSAASPTAITAQTGGGASVQPFSFISIIGLLWFMSLFRRRRVVKGGEGKGFGGSDLSSYFETNNRCKKSLVLDLNKSKAREVLYQLVAKSDVFVQNMRTGVVAKLGCDYKILKKHNPKLIYCSASGFGTIGPDARKPGMDISGCARSGWMHRVPLESGDPLYALSGSSDQIGAILASHAIVAALLARERFGMGQEIETLFLFPGVLIN